MHILVIIIIIIMVIYYPLWKYTIQKKYDALCNQRA